MRDFDDTKERILVKLRVKDKDNWKPKAILNDAVEIFLIAPRAVIQFVKHIF